jgi:drug/metabolite transporter (DMT)-like permease
VLGIALGLASSLSFGISDFLAGITARRVGTLAVLLFSMVVYFALAVLWIVLSGTGAPTASQVGYASAAGVGVGIGLAAFYQGLAVGTMSIVAPIAATGVIVPIVAGIVGGDDPGLVRSLGMASAVVGIVLAVRAPQTQDASQIVDARRSFVYAVIAALGFGTFYWLVSPASETSLPWTLLICRTITLPVVIGVVVVAGASLRRALERRALAATCAIGALSLVAIYSYAEATRHGDLSIVAVAASLYPAVTTVLARYRLDEHLAAGQQGGVLAVLLGIVLMAAG